MSHNNPRLGLEDDMLSAFSKMSEGNPGALTVLMQAYQKGAEIDPDNAFGGYGAMLALDGADIYGSRIWGFYKDVSDSNLVIMLALLRAAQLGFCGHNALTSAIDARGMDSDVRDALVDKVKARLPAFGQSVAA